MAFIPNPNRGPAPHAPGAPPPAQIRVAPDDSKPWVGRAIMAGLVAIGFLYFGWDFYNSATDRGMYVREFSGTVVSARPRFDDLLDLLTSSRSSRRSSYYVRSTRRSHMMVVKDDAGVRHTIAITQFDYYETKIPEYVVGHQGSIRHFRSRDEAVAQGAVPAKN